MVLIAVYGLLYFVILNFINYSVPGGFIKKIYNSLYTLVEFGVFASIFWLNIRATYLKKIILISFTPFLITQFFYLKSDIKFDTIPIGVETILVFIYIFFFFYDYFKNVDTEYIYNHYCFWLAIGIMIYLSGSFFLYILANHITDEQNANFWYFTYIAETIKNILFAFSMIIYSRQKLKEKIPNQNIPYLDFN